MWSERRMVYFDRDVSSNNFLTRRDKTSDLIVCLFLSGSMYTLMGLSSASLAPLDAEQFPAPCCLDNV